MTARRALLSTLLVSLAGCAMPVRETPLQGLGELQTLQWRNFVDERLRGQVRLGRLQGADEEALGFLQSTLARLWGSRLPAKPLGDAIEEQLLQLRLLATLSDQARYALDVQVLHLDNDSEAELHWRLTEVASGRLLFDRRLRSQGAAPFYQPWPPARHRAAKEEALRANLVKLAEALTRLRV